MTLLGCVQEPSLWRQLEPHPIVVHDTPRDGGPPDVDDEQMPDAQGCPPLHDELDGPSIRDQVDALLGMIEGMPHETCYIDTIAPHIRTYVRRFLENCLKNVSMRTYIHGS